MPILTLDKANSRRFFIRRPLARLPLEAISRTVLGKMEKIARNAKKELEKRVRKRHNKDVRGALASRRVLVPFFESRRRPPPFLR